MFPYHFNLLLLNFNLVASFCSLIALNFIHIKELLYTLSYAIVSALHAVCVWTCWSTGVRSRWLILTKFFVAFSSQSIHQKTQDQCPTVLTEHAGLVKDVLYDQKKTPKYFLARKNGQSHAAKIGQPITHMSNSNTHNSFHIAHPQSQPCNNLQVV